MRNLDALRNYPRTHPLATRLVVYIFLFSTVFALIATAVQMFTDYKGELSVIDQRFELIENSYIDSLSASVWSVNERQIKLILDGILQFPDVVAVELESEIDVNLKLGHLDQSSEIITRDYQLYSTLYSTLHPARKDRLGNLKVSVSLDAVYARLTERLMIILVSQGVKAALVSTFILLIFQFLVSRHLSKMAAFARTLRSDTLAEPLLLIRQKIRDDELQQVVNAINHMRLSLMQEFNTKTSMTEALLDSEARFRGMFEHAAIGIGHIDPNYRWRNVNDKLCRIFDCESNHVLGRPFHEFFFQSSVVDDKEAMAKLFAGEASVYNIERQCCRADGLSIWVNITMSVVNATEPSEHYIVAVLEDIALRKHAELEAKKLYQAVEQSTSGVVMLDLDGNVDYVNSSALTLLKFDGQSTKHLKLVDVLSMMTDQSCRAAVSAAVEQQEVWRGEICFQFDEQTLSWLKTSITPVKNASGQVTSCLVVIEDNTEQKRTQELLAFQANYDSLTELPNRNLMFTRIEEAVSAVEEHGGIGALLYIDLDNFKYVNDTFGHAVGDELLVKVARRLDQIFSDDHTVARLGGDEFLVVVPTTENRDTIAATVNELLSRFRAPFSLSHGEVFMSPSVGITQFPIDGVSAAVLLCNADAAMYRAKLAGRNGFSFFTKDMSEHAKNRVAVETELRYAIDRQELDLHFQPIIDLASQRCIGAEALIRWNNPQLGNVPPDGFLSIAEDTGLIIPIGEFIIDRACEQLALWQRQFSPQFAMAINISPRQLLAEGFYDVLEETVKKYDLQPNTIELELTEHMLIANTKYTLELLQQLDQRGYRLSLDDFGTGYSALSYLKHYPFQILKIDQSFIREARNDKGTSALVRAIIAMAAELSLAVIAEGVESVEDTDFLVEEKCDFAQGYYYSKPVAANQFASYLTEKGRVS